MNISLYKLSKDQTNIIKGVAMVCLVLHNFLHLTNDIGENELDFNPDRIFVLFDAIKNVRTMIFNGSFSYFGFYALELFLFLSGFGLTKQYFKHKSQNKSYLSYLFPRLIKLYSLLIFGIILLFFSYLCFKDVNLKMFLDLTVSTLLMYNNFSYDRIFMYIGPWWYFGLTIQLYLIFPLLYKILDKFKEKGFVIVLLVSYFLIFILSPITYKLGIPIFGNFLGHVPEFVLGISFAMYPRFNLNGKIVLSAFVVFVLSCFFKYFYPFTFLSATVLLLAITYPLINPRLNPLLKKALISLGSISMFMFLINGPLRDVTLPFFGYGHPLKILFGSLVHLVFVIIVSYIISFIYNKTMNPFVAKLLAKLN